MATDLTINADITFW